VALISLFFISLIVKSNNNGNQLQLLLSW